MKCIHKLLCKHVQFIRKLQKEELWHYKDNNNAGGNFATRQRKEVSGDDVLFKFVWVRRARRPFSHRLLLSNNVILPLLYSRAESRSRSVGQSHVLYRSLSMEREAVLSTATQWPSPLEVRALPHFKLRAFPTDMSKCTGRSIECVSNGRAGCARMPI